MKSNYEQIEAATLKAILLIEHEERTARVVVISFFKKPEGGDIFVCGNVPKTLKIKLIKEALKQLSVDENP